MRSTIVVCAVLACTLPDPAAAQTFERSRQLCLLRPTFVEGLPEACTAVIEAPRTSPLERAIALNNRATHRLGDEAERDLDEAIRLSPRLAKLYNNRGLHRMYGTPRLALDDFNEALRLDPRYAVAWNNRGETYASLKDYDRAIADFDHAIRLAPSYLHPMYNPYEQRAQALEARGDPKAAEIARKRYFPLFHRAGVTKADLRGPNASGLRTWEPFISLSEVGSRPWK
jgi:tetratricopeptide (TPR) repeat protein